MTSRSVYLLAVILFLQSLLISNSQADPKDTASDKNSNSKTERISVAVTVDPRIELFSIIFRLAGNTEYNQCKIPKYDKDIKKTFHSYEEHAAVKYAKEIRNKYGVSYDAPMSLAVYLSDVNSLNLLVPLEPRPPKLDSRWKPEETKEFLQKAKLFVQDSDFLTFFNEHKQLYKKASEKFQKMLEENANLQWFDEYFAIDSTLMFNIVLGMANGPHNYGPSAIIGDTEYCYSIIGARRTDLFGNPVFNAGFVCTVIHELGHSYVNPIVQRNFSKLKPAGEVLFPKVESKMKKNGLWKLADNDDRER